LLWGDTHVHTVYSADAYINNNLSGDPDTAYRYARGVPVIHPFHRARVQIDTPLDFLVISDHAEYLGVIRHIHRDGVITDGLAVVDTVKAWLAEWVVRYAIKKGEGFSLFSSLLPPPSEPREAARQASLGNSLTAVPAMLDVQRDTWKSITDAADFYNEPGEFSALIGWEWGSMPGGANLHRVIISDSDAATAQRYRPYSLLDSLYPPDLWQWLEQTSSLTGSAFIAIPHNSNISKGLMFDDRTLAGEPFTPAYIARRMRWERVAEITQTKGDSETHSTLSPQDPFADFENYPHYIQNAYTPYDPQPGDFIRSALNTGLRLEAEIGQNPFQFGVIGSTDTHTALSSAEENNFWGKMATDSIPENKQGNTSGTERKARGWSMSASGRAAVWARENTRSAILEALRRREVYATSGPRITLQFFAAADYSEADLLVPDLYRHATETGVPMGGELQAPGSAPAFLVVAARDPLGANLDRIQIIKGWLDQAGVTREQVFNVAWSDDRRLDGQGNLPPVGSSVDVSTGHYSNTIGAGQLAAVWRDPKFNPQQAAFYYVRVLQIPTPRHSLYDALALGLEHAGDQPDTIQERAYSSPIWYRP
jgi:hypothetical protein